MENRDYEDNIPCIHAYIRMLDSIRSYPFPSRSSYYAFSYVDDGDGAEYIRLRLTNAHPLFSREYFDQTCSLSFLCLNDTSCFCCTAASGPRGWYVTSETGNCPPSMLLNICKLNDHISQPVNDRQSIHPMKGELSLRRWFQFASGGDGQRPPKRLIFLARGSKGKNCILHLVQGGRNSWIDFYLYLFITELTDKTQIWATMLVLSFVKTTS